MLKLVIDTNVIISALLKPQSNPALVASLILQGNCPLCLSDEILVEYEEVLALDKFKRLDQASVKEFLSTLKRRALWVVPKVSIDKVAKDPADNAFLECALEAKADFIITGNKKHFPFEEFKGSRIVSPREFISEIGKEIEGESSV